MRAVLTATCLLLALTPAGAKPVPDLTPEGKPNVQAPAALFVDLASGDELFARDADHARPIASISKLMAALVVMDKGLDLKAKQQITEVDKEAARGGATSRLHVTYELRNHDLLRAALLGSDNRAVIALGRSVGLAPRALAAAMSEKARALGLLHMHFDDPTGLAGGNVATPRELVKLLVTVLRVPELAAIMATERATVDFTNRKGTVTYTNTNRLTRSGKSRWTIFGGKTGFTEVAGHCLVTIARLADGREVAMAVLGGEGELTRFADFSRLAKWVTAETREGRLALPAKGPEAEP